MSATGLPSTTTWPSVASPAPDLMIGQIAAVTRNIRVGSGGVMLPNHAPLVVAERFKMLEALFPRPHRSRPRPRARHRRRHGACAAQPARPPRGRRFPRTAERLVLWETRDFPAGHPYNNVVAMPDDYAAAADLAARLIRLQFELARKSAWASRSRIISRPMTRSRR
jgi:hypothetical protein